MDHKQSTGAGPVEDVEVWEPDAPASVRPRVGAGGRHLTVSVPGAIAGAFLVCALAFGSSLGTGHQADPDLTSGAAAATDDASDGAALAGNGDALGRVGGAGSAFGIAAQTEQGETIPETEPGTEPGTEPEGGTAPDPNAEPAAIGLELALRERDVKLAWTVCDVDGFVAYKIIRSTDAGASYPRAEGDVLVGAVEAAGKTRFVDERAPAGKRLWYAVFGIARAGDTTFVACVSEVESIVTPAKPEPTPKPKPTETPAPDRPTLALKLVIDEGHPWLDWSTCEVDGAEAYKVVRSTDNVVRWPLGEHDSLVKVVGMDGKTAFFDKEAPAGKRLWYRVFCVKHVGEGYKVLAASETKSIVTPKAEEPAPEPQALWLEVGSDGGHAVLHWEACTADPFSHYRIVRKTYEGTTVVKEIENRDVTTWVDESVVVGETYKYTVQCKGHVGNSYPLLGTSDTVAVTIE